MNSDMSLEPGAKQRQRLVIFTHLKVIHRHFVGYCGTVERTWLLELEVTRSPSSALSEAVCHQVRDSTSLSFSSLSYEMDELD